ncbi:MAG: bifunctional riboflavin kinase/FAD synthetase [Planctomycetota bacterium]
MKLLRRLEQFPSELRGGALTIGNFDGVHRGHKHVMQRLKQHAAAVNGPAIVFTFDPHPARLLRPEHSPPPLTWIDRKAELLSELGVDAVVAYPTDLALLHLEYADFFHKIVLERIGARAMVEGPNFYFGHDRQGDVQKLAELCTDYGLALEVVQPKLETSGEEMISSSRIRRLIGSGDVAGAGRLLTQPYRIRGLVVHGSARGASLGFPTANLDAIDTLVPAHGVYVGRAQIERRWYWTAVHIGPNPTFGEFASKVEIHVLDFDGSLYGTVLEVDFIDRIRGVKAFADIESLRTQLQRDIEFARDVARRWVVE